MRVKMSTELKRQKRIAKVIKAMEKMTLELQQDDVTDAEFNELALQANRFVQLLYSKRSSKSRAAQYAFGEAMNTLRKLRNIYDAK